jgi:hypothetical protein
MKVHDYMGSIFWLGIGLYVCVGAYRLGFGTYQEPGSGFIFMFSGSLLTVLSLIDLLRTFLRKVESRKKIWSGLKWLNVILVLIGLSAYVYFFELSGFFLSSFLLMLFLFKVVEPTKWRVAIVSSLITISIAYIIFSVWLKVPFPKGFLGV